MTREMLFVFAVIAAAGVLFLSGKVRLDVVALLVVLSLVLSGTLTAPEAFSGFGDPVIALVAGLLVISEMLTRTGVAHQIGSWLSRHGRGGEVRLLLLLTLVVAALGSFMSNTAVVAIFIPVVLSVANTTRMNASRLLMPLAFAGVVSGMLTLIATTPNLVVSAKLVRAGYAPFSFFSFTPVGLAVLAVFAAYMVLVGRNLLPGDRVALPKTEARSIRELLAEFELPGRSRRLKVPADSPLVGRTLAGAAIGRDFGLRVIIVERTSALAQGVTTAPTAELVVRAGDVLVARGTRGSVERLAEAHGLTELPVSDADRARWAKGAGIAKVLIHPESRLIGNTLRKAGLHSGYGVQVLGLRRKHRTLEDFPDQTIKSGDAMLVVGPWKRIRRLQSELHDFVVLALPAEIEQVASAWQRAPVALAILVLMVVLSVTNLVPIAIAVTICALLAVVTRCMTMEQAYRSIHWSAVVLIAGMMSVAMAVQKTGAMELVVGGLVERVGPAGPYALMAVLFALAAVLSMVLSSTPTAILLAPVAVHAAEALGISPYAFAMTVAIASSAGFVMPVASPAVMLVVGPGKYKLVDFVKAGAPMLALTAAVTLVLVPWLFPFHG